MAGADDGGMRILLLAGATGTRLDSFADVAYNTVWCGCGLRVYREKFESVLEREFGGERIEKIAHKAIVGSRDLVVGKFAKVLDRIVADARKHDSDVLILSAHLSYITDNTIVINPIVHRLNSIAGDMSIVYIVEDYYDSLRRIAERINARDAILEKPLSLDPIFYLSWRGFEHNLLSSMKHAGNGIKITLFGAKHPEETFRRLVRALACGGHYTSIYYSHPIRTPRSLRNLAGDRISLARIPVIEEIEKVKQILRKNGVILYEPTTIDEMIREDYCRILEYIEENYRGWIAKILGEAGVGKICEAKNGYRIQVLSPVITGENRWPVPVDTVNRDYPYTINDVIDIIDIAYRTGGGGFSMHLLREIVEDALHGERKWASEPYMLSRLEALIQGQIEQRDYTYVEQADVIVAVSPFYYTIQHDDGQDRGVLRAWLEVSSGMEAEIRRADALGKRIVMVALPIGLRYIAKGICENLSREAGCMGSMYRKLLDYFTGFKGAINLERELREGREAFYAAIAVESESVLEYSDGSSNEGSGIVEAVMKDEIAERFGSRDPAPLVLFSAISTVILPWSRYELENAFRSLFS